MSYSDKTAPNKTSLIESQAWTPVTPTLKPTTPGPQGNGVTGEGLEKRTHSPNAQNEELFETIPNGPKKTT